MFCIGINCCIFCAVVVPDQAFVLDWVFADGPPKGAAVYDNNKRQDFHAIVPLALPEELYWVEEEQRIYRRLQEERRIREEAIHAKVSLIVKSESIVLKYIISMTIKIDNFLFVSSRKHFVALSVPSTRAKITKD